MIADTTTEVGNACGFSQGELQAALSNVKAIVGIVTPMVWGRIYSAGINRGLPSLFYYVSAAGGAVQLLILWALMMAPDPPPRLK